jgi:hypothetical protein
MAEAKLNREYAWRLSGVGALMVGMCLWSVYDGAEAWPRMNREVEQARGALLATNLTAEAWIEPAEAGGSPLEAAFAARGLKPPAKLVKKLGELKVPEPARRQPGWRDAQAERVRALFERPLYSPHDLRTQFIQAAVTLLLGAAAFLSVWRKSRRRFVADETGLHGSGFGGRTIAYAALAGADWSRWDEKGIVTLRLATGERLKLDGWHYAGVTGLVDEIRRRRPDLAPAAAGGAAAAAQPPA